MICFLILEMTRLFFQYLITRIACFVVHLEILFSSLLTVHQPIIQTKLDMPISIENISLELNLNKENYILICYTMNKLY